MIWSDAFKLLKEGKFIKLPSWTGYWSWDEEKKNVVMHCKPDKYGVQENILLSHSMNMEYTLSNIASDEWIEATSENCTLLGGISTFDWKTAAKYLLRDNHTKIGCKHWPDDVYVQGYQQGGIKKYFPEYSKNILPIQSNVGKIINHVDWVPSAEDMLLDDFYFIKEEKKEE